MAKKVTTYFIKFFLLLAIGATIYFGHKFHHSQIIHNISTANISITDFIEQHQKYCLTRWTKYLDYIKRSKELIEYTQALSENKIDNIFEKQYDLEKLFLNIYSSYEGSKFINFVGYHGQDLVVVKDKSISNEYVDHKNCDCYHHLFKNQQHSILLTKDGDFYTINIVEPVMVNNKLIGHIHLGYKLEQITTELNHLVINGLIDNIFIIDKNMNILYSSNLNSMQKALSFEGEKFPLDFIKNKVNVYKNNIFASKAMESLGIYIGTITYEKSINNMTKQILITNIIMFILIMIFSTISCILSMKFACKYLK